MHRPAPDEHPRAERQRPSGTSDGGKTRRTVRGLWNGSRRVANDWVRPLTFNALVDAFKQSWTSGSSKAASTAATTTSGPSTLITSTAARRTAMYRASSSCVRQQPESKPSWRSACHVAPGVIDASRSSSALVYGEVPKGCPRHGDAGSKLKIATTRSNSGADVLTADGPSGHAASTGTTCVAPRSRAWPRSSQMAARGARSKTRWQSATSCARIVIASAPASAETRTSPFRPE